ncbi:MAG: glycosyltransferase family 2 protein [Nitrospirota bacterium]
MTEKPLTSIRTVNYNGLKYLSACFDSIKKSIYPLDKLEVIMVDNASSDGSIAFVKESYPWVKVIALNENTGFSKANNIGAKNAQGEYVVFLNNDTVVDPNWLNGLVQIMESDRDIGIVGSKLLLMDTPTKLNSAGAAIAFNGGGYDIGFLDNDSDVYNTPGERGCVRAAAAMVRREEFLDFGGFDEDHFMYFEDVDLCWRYWLFGKKIVYIPSSVIYHKFGGSSGTFRHAPLRVFYGTRNALLNIFKNYQMHNIPLPFLFSFFIHTLEILYFIARFDFSLALLKIKAYASFLQLLPKTLAKRKDIQKRREIADRYLFNHSLIVSASGYFKEFLRLVRAEHSACKIN